MGSEFLPTNLEPGNLAAGSGETAVRNSQLIDLIAEKASSEADARAQKRERSRRGALMLGLIGTGLVVVSTVCAALVLGFQTIKQQQEAKIARDISSALQSKAMHDDIGQIVDSAVQDKLEKKIGQLLARLDGAAAYQQFLVLATQLEMRESFSDADRERVIALLTSLKESGQYAQQPGFDDHIKKVVDNFTSAYQVAAVDTLDELYRAELSRLKDVPRWLTNHFGRVVVTSPAITDRKSRQWERLRYYSDVTKQNRNPEISLFWDTIAEFVLAYERKSPEVDRLVGQLSHLNAKDRGIFMEALHREGTASQKEPPDMQRLAQIVAKFVAAYRVDLVGYGFVPD